MYAPCTARSKLIRIVRTPVKPAPVRDPSNPPEIFADCNIWYHALQKGICNTARAGNQGGAKKRCLAIFNIYPLEMFWDSIESLLCKGRDIKVDETRKGHTIRTVVEQGDA